MNRRHVQICILVLSAGLLPALAAAQSESASLAVPSIQQAMEMKSVSSPQISPDGKYVAYEMTHTDWDQNAFVRQIWIAVPATGQTYQLTNGKKSATDATWSPDGKWLAFLSSRESDLPDAKKDTAQIYLISPDGGEARQSQTLKRASTVSIFRRTENISRLRPPIRNPMRIRRV